MLPEVQSLHLRDGGSHMYVRGLVAWGVKWKGVHKGSTRSTCHPDTPRIITNGAITEAMV